MSSFCPKSTDLVEWGGPHSKRLGLHYLFIISKHISLCARNYSKCFPSVSLFNPHKDFVSSHAPLPTLQMEKVRCTDVKSSKAMQLGSSRGRIPRRVVSAALLLTRAILPVFMWPHAGLAVHPQRHPGQLTWGWCWADGSSPYLSRTNYMPVTVQKIYRHRPTEFSRVW